MLKLLPLLFVFACAHHQPEFKFDSNAVVWMNRSEDDVLTHPIFATLKMEKRKTESGIKMYSFRNSGGYSTKTNCTGGSWNAECNSNQNEISCNHLFTIKEKVVTNYQRIGDCASEQLKFRPVENGEAVLTEREKAFFGKRTIANEPMKKECGLAGKIFGC